ncbi:SNARE domain-containing protein [Cryptosporidium muris RN66]|uniref:SNARE domain-containing protein n=1 Tax=Cryptosporidium muris (strain RN66) TaxID=441375 RepID=B6AI48_CRYMR|nr:SNARE domain-containing protein [Cryptosporidium muris RN66]EEA07889.1 SNARE domain-containing protein [Cryptosporidium muris RN66]|eukprot:XP_002142238.1 SNARE domain-containing protein [Cryptosporidium muris RN66]
MLSSDRTREFFDIIDESDRNETNSYILAASNQSYSNSIKGSQFNLLASEISQEMNSTSIKLQELNRLVKYKGLFRDRSSHIQDLTEEIKQSVTDLNSKLEILQKHAEQGFPSSGGYYQSNQHYSAMVETLKTRMLDITKGFRDALQKRTETMQQQDWRRNLYTYTSNNSGLQQISSAMSSKISGNIPGNNKYNKVPFDIESGLEGEQMMAMQEQNQSFSYAHSRAEAVENVQRMIGELAQIFQKVAGMVTQQEEMIQRIDEDITNTFSNVEHGHNELLKYHQYVKSNRGLIIKLFAMIIAFIIFFVIFLT